MASTQGSQRLSGRGNIEKHSALTVQEPSSSLQKPFFPVISFSHWQRQVSTLKTPPCTMRETNAILCNVLGKSGAGRTTSLTQAPPWVHALRLPNTLPVGEEMRAGAGGYTKSYVHACRKMTVRRKLGLRSDLPLFPSVICPISVHSPLHSPLWGPRMRSRQEALASCSWGCTGRQARGSPASPAPAEARVANSLVRQRMQSRSPHWHTEFLKASSIQSLQSCRRLTCL